MKKLYTLLLSGVLCLAASAQQNFNNFEGTRIASLAQWNGQMDTMHVVPAPNSVNSSSYCARYTRSTTAYDNFKFFPYGKLVDVTPYASNSVSAPKMTMKVYTSAPAGSSISLQLGVRSNTNYPAGIHSEYTGVTTAQNTWHTITFNFSQLTPGSTVNPNNIDKVVILFKPNTTATDTLYFDDFTGPSLNIAGVAAIDGLPGAQLLQNRPNPAQGSTHIDLSLEQAGPVSLKVYDVLGNSLATLLDGNLEAGSYSVPFETTSLKNGIYFYELKAGNASRTIKMTVAN